MEINHLWELQLPVIQQETFTPHRAAGLSSAPHTSGSNSQPASTVKTGNNEMCVGVFARRCLQNMIILFIHIWYGMFQYETISPMSQPHVPPFQRQPAGFRTMLTGHLWRVKYSEPGGEEAPAQQYCLQLCHGWERPYVYSLQRVRPSAGLPRRESYPTYVP